MSNETINECWPPNKHPPDPNLQCTARCIQSAASGWSDWNQYIVVDELSRFETPDDKYETQNIAARSR